MELLSVNDFVALENQDPAQFYEFSLAIVWFGRQNNTSLLFRQSVFSCLLLW